MGNSRDPIDQVDETDTDDSQCIDHQVIHVDTSTGQEIDAPGDQRPRH